MDAYWVIANDLETFLARLIMSDIDSDSDTLILLVTLIVTQTVIMSIVVTGTVTVTLILIVMCGLFQWRGWLHTARLLVRIRVMLVFFGGFCTHCLLSLVGHMSSCDGAALVTEGQWVRGSGNSMLSCGDWFTQPEVRILQDVMVNACLE